MSVAELFRKRVGRDPEGLWSAPGRVNLIGEHTDYNGGFVLPFAIDRRTRVAAARRPDRVVTAHSLQRPDDDARANVDDLLAAQGFRGWAGYVFGVLWALREAGFDIGGLDIVVDSDVPSGSGLSSSAALECAVGLAALDLHGFEVAPEHLARLAQRSENDYVGVPCGLMDQMAASVCRADHALFFDVRDDIREQLPFALRERGLTLLVIDTRAEHAHSGGEYAKRRSSCETAARQLGVAFLRDIGGPELDAALSKLDDEILRKRARHVVTENARVLASVELLKRGAVSEIGPLLTASHVSLRDDFEVSSPELDTAVDAALRAGALGSRMTGGGFGGSAIALVERDRAEDVERAVVAAFAEHGFTLPRVMAPGAAGGAARDA